MYTRRLPRTMQAAFGPFTDNVLHPMPAKKTTPVLVRWLQRILGVNK
jgi:hypothetical protein